MEYRPAISVRRVLSVALVLSILGTAGVAAPPGANGADERGSSAHVLAADLPATQVTLITGDRIVVRPVADERSAVEIQPAARPHGMVPQFHVTTHDGDLHVVPSDVHALIPDVLDPELFNVTSLIDQGFGDPASSTLPLIFEYAEATARAVRSDPLPAARSVRALESIDAVAVEADKSKVDEIAKAVFGLAAAGPTDRGAALTAAAQGPLTGVGKVWLDRRVTAVLDRSTSQISAPAAWAAGYDGTGVTVAVLDTGIDDTHPDLAGQVVGAQDFTTDGTVRDLHGHGTHVASIIAGTGAASAGSRRGVADGAELISGRVLDAEGFGMTSWIIDGMEWAAAERDADIVNMSLGAPPGHPEAPLMTQALEELSSTHGTLFVVAAGNGQCSACIGSPADAPSALTVGAVDRNDQLADFSSRGPVFGTFGLKPDITAPGVEIVAARAAGTDLGGDGDYVPLSGTSMAAPHVAGSAALLFQAHPEFSADELKGALMSTADPTDGLDIFEQGTGRVDIGAAIAGPVLAAPGSLDFGFFAYPQAGSDPATKTVSYRNTSDEPVTLALSLAVANDEGTQPKLAVTQAELTVQPGATATANVVLDAADSATGRYLGHVVAELPDGSQIRTPIGFEIEAERFDLMLKAIARDGRPARPWGNFVPSLVLDVETGEPMNEPCLDESQPAFCVRVPAGTYSVMGFVFTKPEWADSDGNPFTSTPLHTALVGEPELVVDEDVTVVLDAREAVEVTVDTPADETKANLGGAVDMRWSRTPESGPTTTDFLANFPGSQLEERLFMQPMDPVTVGRFSVSTRWRLEAPAIAMTVEAADIDLDPQYYRMDWFSDNSWQFPTLEGTLQLPVADGGSGRADEIDDASLDGALALIRRSDDLTVAEQSNRAAEAGAKVVAIYNDQPGLNADPGPPGEQLTVPTVRLSHAEGVALLEALNSGPVRVTATGTMASPYVYDLVYTERDGIPEDLSYTADPTGLVRVDRDLHTQVAHTITMSEASFPFQPEDEFSIATVLPLQGAPRSRTDYHVSDPLVRWDYTVMTPEEPYNFMLPQQPTGRLRFDSPLTTYAPAERRQQSWLGQPVTAGLNPSIPVVRVDDWLVLGSPRGGEAVGLVDSGGNFSPVFTSETSDGFATLFQVLRGDEVLWETEFVPSGFDNAVLLPTGDAETYHMVFNVENNSSWAGLSTRTRTEWTFGSARTSSPTPEPAALLTIGYALDVDLRNRIQSPARRMGANVVELAVGHQAGVDIAIADVAVAVSYDDGRTWRDLLVHERGDSRYAVTLGAIGPKQTGFVSLRISAEDVDGNRIEQEIIRAAALPPVPPSGIQPR